MIKASAPLRISLFGGGTDLPVFYKKHGGEVISMAIDLRQHISVSDLGEGISMPEWGSEEFYKKIFGGMKYKMPARIVSRCDVPIESGLGASAAATVAMVGIVNEDKMLEMTKPQIAEKAWDLEVNKAGLYGGKQDQYASALGGMNHIVFSKDGVEVMEMPMKVSEFWSDNMALIYTRYKRSCAKVQENLKVPSAESERALEEVLRLCLEAEEPIWNMDFNTTANLLNRSWLAKKRTNKVTNSWIDKVYETAIEAGAAAGKLCGSGGGGFMVFLVRPAYQLEVIRALEGIECVWYDFDTDYEGLRVD